VTTRRQPSEQPYQYGESDERQLKRLAGPLRDAAIAFAADDGLRAADRLGSV
jgi:hypothetical protein